LPRDFFWFNDGTLNIIPWDVWSQYEQSVCNKPQKMDSMLRRN
jgi:hypothetical protein